MKIDSTSYAFTKLRSSAKSDLKITEIDQRCRQVGLYAIVVWLIMTLASYAIGYHKQCIERLSGMERQAPLTAMMLMGMSVVSNILPMAYRWNKGERMTGVITAGLVVQFIAFTTSTMLCTLPVPVFVDPVTGSRVFALRWSEWTPLAYVMTFLTEACHIDSTKMDSSQHAHTTNKNNSNNNNADKTIERSDSNIDNTCSSAYSLALCQGLSTFCGYMFPHIEIQPLWIITMILSCLLFSTIYFRLYKRYNRFQQMSPGTSIGEQEMYNWARVSLGLLSTCSALWSCLVIAYFIYSFGPLIFDSLSFLRTKGVVMIAECFIDVLFKSVYLHLIIDVHKTIFDPNARAQRRLEELRQVRNNVYIINHHHSFIIKYSSLNIFTHNP